MTSAGSGTEHELAGLGEVADDDRVVPDGDPGQTQVLHHQHGSAGFELLDYSTLLRRPDDELLYEVGRRSVTGNSDRFVLLFVKPE